VNIDLFDGTIHPLLTSTSQPNRSCLIGYHLWRLLWWVDNNRSSDGAITTLWTEWQPSVSIPRSVFDLPYWCNDTHVDPCVFRAVSAGNIEDSLLTSQHLGFPSL
jgi:hypothetical protein